MAALVQSFQQPSGTMTMLQTRPSSASGILQSPSSQAQYPISSQHTQRNSFHSMNGALSLGNYRGQSSVAPVAPYAFTSTPNLNPPALRTDQRALSSKQNEAGNRTRYPADASVSTTSSSSSDLSNTSLKLGSKDDSVIPGATKSVGAAEIQPPTSVSALNQSLPVTPQHTAKPSPGRYRRPNNQRTESSSGQQAVPVSPTSPLISLFSGNNDSQSSIVMGSFPEFTLQMPKSPDCSTIRVPPNFADDKQQNRNSAQDPRRYRRRSVVGIDTAASSMFTDGLESLTSRKSSSANGQNSQQNLVFSLPTPSHRRQASSDSTNSARSGPSRPNSVKRDTGSSTFNLATSQLSTTSLISEQSVAKHDVPRLVNIPPRGSSTDAPKRTTNPSPLSKPINMSPDSLTTKDSFASTVNAALQPAKPTYAQVASSASTSPAAAQLAALNGKDGKKSKSSRLRRAFSFGSAAELRRTPTENQPANISADRSKIRQEKYQDELDAEQVKIAQRQEAGGIGSGIYSGQGHFFTGSTDNLSISSTASSASIMIRKMGKGMKKTSRSLVGLFRPKSMIGVPAIDSPVPHGSEAQVSMVTVEAERENEVANVSTGDLTAGSCILPKSEHVSLDAMSPSAPVADCAGSSGTDNSNKRRSIVGGENERAEVLAAVKRGILKRVSTNSSSSSPVTPTVDTNTVTLQLPHISVSSDSPNSTAPSTPNDDEQGHKRTGSVTLGGEDYFMMALRLQGNSKSHPGTPQGSVAKRNATFSPRIQFHDTWPSGEYDRRGEIATCNRLTPMLAQQIKEELNSFKMEMEVHENSKIYTHFF